MTEIHVKIVIDKYLINHAVEEEKVKFIEDQIELLAITCMLNSRDFKDAKTLESVFAERKKQCNSWFSWITRYDCKILEVCDDRKQQKMLHLIKEMKNIIITPINAAEAIMLLEHPKK